MGRSAWLLVGDYSQCNVLSQLARHRCPAHDRCMKWLLVMVLSVCAGCSTAAYQRTLDAMGTVTEALGGSTTPNEWPCPYARDPGCECPRGSH